MAGHQFVGRADEIQEFVSRLQHSAGGSFLITGYRGVGKTSFVNQVLSVLYDRMPVLDIYVNLARPLTEADLMHLIVRRLYERLVEKGWYPSLGSELQRRITLAYQRTSANVVRKVSDKWERGLEISAPNLGPIKLPFSPKWTGKTARNIDFETSFLAYDDKAAEQDVISITRSLALGISENRKGWQGVWKKFRRVPLARLAMKIVFVFDELDKLDDKADPNQQSEVEKMLTGLKNLFTTSGICFLFVAGKDLHERWLWDVWRGDSVFERVFLTTNISPACGRMSTRSQKSWRPSRPGVATLSLSSCLRASNIICDSRDAVFQDASCGPLTNWSVGRTTALCSAFATSSSAELISTRS